MAAITAKESDENQTEGLFGWVWFDFPPYLSRKERGDNVVQVPQYLVLFFISLSKTPTASVA